MMDDESTADLAAELLGVRHSTARVQSFEPPPPQPQPQPPLQPAAQLPPTRNLTVFPRSQSQSRQPHSTHQEQQHQALRFHAGGHFQPSAPTPTPAQTWHAHSHPEAQAQWMAHLSAQDAAQQRPRATSFGSAAAAPSHTLSMHGSGIYAGLSLSHSGVVADSGLGLGEIGGPPSPDTNGTKHDGDAAMAMAGTSDSDSDISDSDSSNDGDDGPGVLQSSFWENPAAAPAAAAAAAARSGSGSGTSRFTVTQRPSPPREATPTVPPASTFGAPPLAYHSDYQPHSSQQAWGAGAAVAELSRTWHAGEHQEERVELFQMLEERQLRANNSDSDSALDRQPGMLSHTGGLTRSESFSTDDIAAELFGGRFRGPSMSAMSSLPNIALTTAATVAPVPTPAPIPQHTRTWHATEADTGRAALYGALEQRRQGSATAFGMGFGGGANPDGHDGGHGEQPMSAVMRLESMFGPQR